MSDYWLKMIGAARKPVADRWCEDEPHLLRGVRAPKRPASLKRGDYLVYYASGFQKIFAIAKCSGNGADAPEVGGKGEHDWPYLLDVQVLLAIPQVKLAPDWDVLEIPSSKVMQRSYVELTEEQYKLAHAAIAGRSAIG